MTALTCPASKSEEEVQMPVYITWLGVAFALHGSAQTTPAARIPPVLARAIQRIDPPARPGGWVLQVITRGGLDGRGTGDLTIDSNGDASFVHPTDGSTLGAQHLGVKQLDQSVRGILPSQWTTSVTSSICSDCIVTLMHLALRGTDGSIHTYTVYWDPTSQAQVSPELVRVHDLALTMVPK
jgi:hypothetical protein